MLEIKSVVSSKMSFAFLDACYFKGGLLIRGREGEGEGGGGSDRVNIFFGGGGCWVKRGEVNISGWG